MAAAAVVRVNRVADVDLAGTQPRTLSVDINPADHLARHHVDSTSVLFGGNSGGDFDSTIIYCFDPDEVATVEEIEFDRWKSSLRCEGSNVFVRDLELPTTLRDPTVQWTKTPAGEIVDSGTLQLTADFREREELGFTDVGGDHAIDPTWAAIGTHNDQEYVVSFDLDCRGTHDAGGDRVRDWEVFRLTHDPGAVSGAAPRLLELAGCPPS